VPFDEPGDGGSDQDAVYIRAVDGAPPVRLDEGIGSSFSPDGKGLLLVGRVDGNANRIDLVDLATGQAARRQ
jgi:hypothetical protein